MRLTTTILMGCLCLALVAAVPIPEEGFQSQALDRLMVVEADNESALRSKRTIGLLRQLFPDISKMIEDKVNGIVGEVFKIFGPVVIGGLLRNNNNNKGGGGGTGGGAVSAKNTDGSTVSVKSPFDDDEDDIKSFVDDDDFFDKPSDKDSGSKISIQLPEIESDDSAKATSTTSSPTTLAAAENETTAPSTESVTSNVVDS